MRKRLKLILLEDSDSDAQLIQDELTKAGIEFEARCVHSREDFLRGLAEFEPDLILADYTLPQFTALDALAILKQQRSDLPLILVTGANSEEVAVECIKHGADD